MVVGWVLGPVGDVLSGTGNVARGRLGVGVRQIGFGVFDLTRTTAIDLFNFAYGMTVGKTVAVGKNLGFAGGEFRIGRVLMSLLIPSYGFLLGGNHGYDQSVSPKMDFRKKVMGPWTKLDYASLSHDYRSIRERERNSQASHYGGQQDAQWVRDVWRGQGCEPGIFGQMIRLVGTPVFLISAKLKK